ncbi:MAG TPA: hypothetical protein VNS22_24580 [Geminicoccus sp.]|uniref:hypothetical protein n=1 Tax=Geminicoccus sp. TaxID=2024832 RepID=UPI002C82EE54|nr:hypothetical protein [Geminicoccus sp.]HWL71534.1 hypothetical protein [Geminicoccus sp.]
MTFALANGWSAPYICWDQESLDEGKTPSMNMVLRKVAGFGLLAATLGIAGCQALFAHAF